MSQPAPGKDVLGPVIESKDQLLAYFASGEKTRDAFRIGTEHEKFGFFRATKKPIGFDGEGGIESILRGILHDAQDRAAHGAYTPIEEDGRLIGLTRQGASVTLEPGGQLELSGAPLRTIFETCAEVEQHLRLLKRVCLPMGVGFLGIGYHPTATWDDMADVPKSRYGIMRRYMPSVGGRGLDMMKRTCTVQANFDFSSEADMRATMQTALKIAPVVTAMFANSPFAEGALTGRSTERSFVWTDTDPGRAGFPPTFLDPGFSYETYLEWLLDVPMYFIRRDGIHHDQAGKSFRTFMTEGIDGVRATMRDFEDHLTVAFPEVRLKTFIEVRSADCGPWSRICALPAFYKGVLYHEDTRAEAAAIIGDVTADELKALHRDVCERGYQATFRKTTVQVLAQRLLDASRRGLEALAGEAQPETRFIDALTEEAARGENFSDVLRKLYTNAWDESLDPLWEQLEFFSDESDVFP